MRRYAVVPMARGSVGLVATERGLCRVILMRHRPEAARAVLGRAWPGSQYRPSLLPALQAQLRDYFAGRRVRFRVKLDLSALTPFQRRVLMGCARIAYGKTMAYGALARRVGHPAAARAVGHALARNPVPIVIPCHRVVACDGSLGGFSAPRGVAMKRWLLELEGGVPIGGAAASRRR